MIRVNCFVHDCRHQVRYNCELPIAEMGKTGQCQSFAREKGRVRRTVDDKDGSVTG